MVPDGPDFRWKTVFASCKQKERQNQMGLGKGFFLSISTMKFVYIKKQFSEKPHDDLLNSLFWGITLVAKMHHCPIEGRWICDKSPPFFKWTKCKKMDTWVKKARTPEKLTFLGFKLTCSPVTPFHGILPVHYWCHYKNGLAFGRHWCPVIVVIGKNTKIESGS
jgi:hypothetical protein